MKVKIHPFSPGLCTGNIIWSPAHPMRSGRFPATHPVAPNGKFGTDDQIGSTPALDAFRARGYWASCFPEGDGITFYPEDKQPRPIAQYEKDVRECFGFTTEQKPDGGGEG